MDRDEIELESRMARLRQLARPAAFRPGFADRVMARLERQSSLADGLQVVFLRLAPLAAAAALIVGAINLGNSSSSGQPFVERALGLEPVTLAAAYAIESDLVLWGEVQP